MARHLRESEAIGTMVVSAHATGALIATGRPRRSYALSMTTDTPG
jgi:hypothetical protein